MISGPDLAFVWRNFAAFLSRPYGGMEVEIVICLSEIGQAILLLLAPSAADNTRAFRDLPVAPSLIAVPFLVSAMLTIVGIFLFFLHIKECAPLRWCGASLSIVIWAWMGTKSGIVVSWDFGYIITCYLFSLWSMRISAAAWKRWEPWRLWLPRP